MALLNWIDTLFFGIRRIIDSLGNELPDRPTLKFVNAAVTDNPTENRLDVDMTLQSDAQHGTLGALIGSTPMHALSTNISPGFISSAHHRLLAGAVPDPTVDTLMLRDSSGGAGLQYLWFGTAPATTGIVRFSSFGSLTWPADDEHTIAESNGSLLMYDWATIELMSATFSPKNVGLFGADTGASGIGSGVLAIAAATTEPIEIPPAGTGYLFVDSADALVYLGSSGTETTLGPAGPHCPRCGRDFVLHYRNRRLGEQLLLCLPCLVKTLHSVGLDITEFVSVGYEP